MFWQIVDFHVDCRLPSLRDLHLFLGWVNNDLIVVIRKRLSSLCSTFDDVGLDVLNEHVLLGALRKAVAALHCIFFVLDLEDLQIADVCILVVSEDENERRIIVREEARKLNKFVRGRPSLASRVGTSSTFYSCRCRVCYRHGSCVCLSWGRVFALLFSTICWCPGTN